MPETANSLTATVWATAMMNADDHEESSRVARSLVLTQTPEVVYLVVLGLAALGRHRQGVAA